jgi:hypothetical protein
MLFSPVFNLFRRKENKVFIKKGKNIVPLPTDPQNTQNQLPVEVKPIVQSK